MIGQWLPFFGVLFFPGKIKGRCHSMSVEHVVVAPLPGDHFGKERGNGWCGPAEGGASGFEPFFFSGVLVTPKRVPSTKIHTK